MDKKLYKSETDKKLCGVCGGIAKYFNIDSTIIRLLWALSLLCCGCGLVAYIICAIVIPDEPFENQYSTYCNINEQDCNGESNR
ncbi:MAG: PspC domain-containing protein [Eubacterium sp.]